MFPLGQLCQPVESRATKLLQSDDKGLVQILRKIKVASQILQNPEQELSHYYDDADHAPDLKYVYLLADSGLSQDRQYVINIADNEFTEEVDSNNTVGSLFNLKNFIKLRQAEEKAMLNKFIRMITEPTYLPVSPLKIKEVRSLLFWL